MIIDMNTYCKSVSEAIKNFKDFSGTEVNHLERLKTLHYSQDEYQRVLRLINERKLEELNDLDIRSEGFKEYVDIMRFEDENGTSFMATIYDSDEMWQDPQVMNIFPY